jgi:hypothetical protein
MHVFNHHTNDVLKQSLCTVKHFSSRRWCHQTVKTQELWSFYFSITRPFVFLGLDKCIDIVVSISRPSVGLYGVLVTVAFGVLPLHFLPETTDPNERSEVFSVEHWRYCPEEGGRCNAFG